MKVKKYKRVGKCKQCGICCMIKDGTIKNYAINDTEMISYITAQGWQEFKRTKKTIYFVRLTPCKQLYLKNNGKYYCKLHGKTKPETCRIYPQEPQQFYELCKKFCGFKFKEVKT